MIFLRYLRKIEVTLLGGYNNETYECHLQPESVKVSGYCDIILIVLLGDQTVDIFGNETLLGLVKI